MNENKVSLRYALSGPSSYIQNTIKINISVEDKVIMNQRMEYFDTNRKKIEANILKYWPRSMYIMNTSSS